MCMALLFCDYEKQGGDEVNIVCLFLKPLKCFLHKKCSLKQHYENFGTFSVAHGYEKLGNSKIYVQFFT